MPEPFNWRRGPLLAVLTLLLGAAVLSAQTDDPAILARLKKDLTYLTSAECEGRGIDTKGIHKAAEYIANEFKQAGLKPGGKDGTYFQPFPVGEGTAKIEGENTVSLKGPLGQTIELKMDKDFKVLPLSASGTAEAPVVFAGYGLSVPHIGYDDFKGVDVAGKIVVVLRRTPRWNHPSLEFAGKQEVYQGYEAKIGNAELHKAAAIVLVNDGSEAADADPFLFVAANNSFPANVPIVQLRRNVVDQMLITDGGKTLANLEKDIDRDLKPRSGVIPNWTAAIKTNVTRTIHKCKNVVGVLEGAGPLANETVCISAHYDHLGIKGGNTMYPGADDNGSGTTGIMELARRFAALKDRQGRRLVFMLFSGEERGLLGSRHYCNKEPLFPLENTAAVVNIDMIGRYRDDVPLTAEGFDTGVGMQELLDKLNADYKFKLKIDKSIYYRSDQASFYDKKVPGLFFFTGFHPEYHKPGDTVDKINFAGMAKIIAMTEKLVASLSAGPRPHYIQLEPIQAKKGGAGSAPKLKIGIDFNDESNMGALVEFVTAGGAGDKGGLKVGDRITAIKGVPTPNFAAYTAAMRQQKANVAVELSVMRGGKELKLTVTPTP